MAGCGWLAGVVGPDVELAGGGVAAGVVGAALALGHLSAVRCEGQWEQEEGGEDD